MSDKTSDQKTRVFSTGAFLIALTVVAVIIAVVTLVSGWNPSKAWPLLLTAFGIAGLYTGLSRARRFASGYIVPSLIFIVLSGIFCLFSFDVIPTRLSTFVLHYWPIILVVGAALILLTWLYTWFRGNRKAKNAPPAATSADTPADVQ